MTTPRLTIAGIVATLIIVLFLTVAALREPERQEDAADELHRDSLALGMDLYAQQCADCHGSHGMGVVEGSQDLTRDATRNATREELFRTISRGAVNTEGNDDMAAYALDEGGPLTNQQIDSLVTLIKDGSWNDIAVAVAEADMVSVEEMTQVADWATATAFALTPTATPTLSPTPSPTLTPTPLAQMQINFGGPSSDSATTPTPQAAPTSTGSSLGGNEDSPTGSGLGTGSSLGGNEDSPTGSGLGTGSSLGGNEDSPTGSGLGTGSSLGGNDDPDSGSGSSLGTGSSLGPGSNVNPAPAPVNPVDTGDALPAGWHAVRSWFGWGVE
ncbi:MAG: cytochrome c [Chloroflexi bacterium]|nr:cytochrome c [Chloroflexota bacterium]